MVILLKDWKSLIQPEEMVEDVLATKVLFEKFTSYMYLMSACLVLISAELAQQKIDKEAKDSGCSTEFHIWALSPWTQCWIYWVSGENLEELSGWQYWLETAPSDVHFNNSASVARVWNNVSTVLPVSCQNYDLWKLKCSHT